MHAGVPFSALETSASVRGTATRWQQHTHTHTHACQLTGCCCSRWPPAWHTHARAHERTHRRALGALPIAARCRCCAPAPGPCVCASVARARSASVSVCPPERHYAQPTAPTCDQLCAGTPSRPHPARARARQPGSAALGPVAPTSGCRRRRIQVDERR